MYTLDEIKQGCKYWRFSLPTEKFKNTQEMVNDFNHYCLIHDDNLLQRIKGWIDYLYMEED